MSGDPTRWREFRATAIRSEHTLDCRGMPGGQLPSADDLKVLCALLPLIHETKVALGRADLAHLRVFIGVPSDAWDKPALVDGAQLLGVGLSVHGELSWPVVQWELGDL